MQKNKIKNKNTKKIKIKIEEEGIICKLQKTIIGNETTSPLVSDTSRFIILQVRFPSLQLYSRSKRTVLFNRYLTPITDFTHPKKCHTIVAFTIAQRLIDLSTRRSIVTKSVQLYYYRTISHTLPCLSPKERNTRIVIRPQHER